MPSVRFSRAMQILAAVGPLALAACGGGGGSSSPTPKSYEGQWAYVSGGMVAGADILNLRSDGTYSRTVYYSYTIDDPSAGVGGEKGTYTFTPDTPGDETKGTLAFHCTHRWPGAAWVEATDDESVTFVITAGTPRMIAFDYGYDTIDYQYHDAEAAIPAGFPLPYEGRWTQLGMGSIRALNLRADGTYSDVLYLSGVVDDPTGGLNAYKGTYTVTLDEPTVGADGTLTLTQTHSYDDGAKVWNSQPAAPEDWSFTVDSSGSPRTLTLSMTQVLDYHGPEVAIPATF